MAGYSGTPLARKLGINEGHAVAVLHGPDGFGDVLEPLPDGAVVTTPRRVPKRIDLVVAFYTQRARFESEIDAMGRAVFPDGGLWIAWPKKASKVATDIDENVVRSLGLAAALVDNKVAAIDEVWSGLRLVIRVRDRS